MSTGMSRRAATTAVTLTMAGTLGFGLMTPAASGASQGPCYEGRCTITVSKPTGVKVDRNRFGFGTLNITPLSSRSVKLSVITTGGTYLSGSSTPGGTVRLNNLKILVKSVSGRKATVALSPTS
jgi:hypothetical protein